MPKPLVGSFSLLSSFINCPEQMQRRYIAKDLGPYVETPEIRWGNDVHEAFERRLRDKTKLPQLMKQWENFALPFDGHAVLVEQKLGMTEEGKPADFFGPAVWFRGKGDAIIPKDDIAYMADWKTGKSSYEHPFELETGAMLLKAAYPNLKKVVGQYIWLKENRLGQLYDLSDFNATYKKVAGLMREIAQCRAEGEWTKKPSGLCGWCSVKDCQYWRERK